MLIIIAIQYLKETKYEGNIEVIYIERETQIEVLYEVVCQTQALSKVRL